jgi:hypothetical protein
VIEKQEHRQAITGQQGSQKVAVHRHKASQASELSNKHHKQLNTNFCFKAEHKRHEGESNWASIPARERNKQGEKDKRKNKRN